MPELSASGSPHIVATDPTHDIGLSTASAEQALRWHGPNEIPRGRRTSLVSRIAVQVRDPMILLLLSACLITVWIGDRVDTAVILAVVVLNTALGVGQELRAERALRALTDLAAPTCRVFRDGVLVQRPSRELVVGDVVQLDAGDIVPADVRIDHAVRLQLDESVMTGESVPVERAIGDEVSAGTVVTKGRATGEVVRTGSSSALGQIAALVDAAPSRLTPLQRRLSRLSRLLVATALAACGVVFVLGLARGVAATDMLVISVSLAVAAVPESLPAVVSVALALGAYRMARRSAIVRNLPAVETLGSVTVIASDKTGTLTEGRMTARRIWAGAETHEVTGVGYRPAGAVSGPSQDEAIEDLLRAGALCNDASLTEKDGEWVAVGDPLEAALLAVAMKVGLSPDELRRAWPRWREEPFDAGTQTMTTWHRTRNGERSLEILKGAPERVVPLEVDAGRREAADAVAGQMAADGLRVIAIAQRADVGPSAGPERGVPVHLLGLVGIQDAARETARDVVRSCNRAGVQVVMVTGDHAATARAIATEIGITEAAPGVVDGGNISADALPDGIDAVGVFSRTRPEQKVDIVRALQGAGGIVAVTGDGVNDAPALRAADIGVAMGRGGTEVARQAADLVLGDDDLRTVVVAIEEGRRILANIRRFLCYAISGGLAEILVLVVAPFVGVAIPLVPAQILWINMITHGIPGVAFGAEPLDPAVMRRPSAPPGESVLGSGLARLIVWGGLTIATVSLLVAVCAQELGQPVTTSIFVVLGLAQLALAIALRAPRHRDRSRAGRGLELAVACAGVAQLAAVYLPPLQQVLGTRALELWWLLALCVSAAAPAFVVHAVARRRRRMQPAAEGSAAHHDS